MDTEKLEKIVDEVIDKLLEDDTISKTVNVQASFFGEEIPFSMGKLAKRRAESEKSEER